MVKWTVALAILGAAGFGAVQLMGGGAEEGAIGGVAPEELRWRVERGDLTVSALANGSLRTKETVSVHNETGTQLKVVYVVSNGTQVQEGDLLVEFESNDLQEKLSRQDIAVTNAEDNVYRAVTDIELQESKNKTDELAAGNNFKIAEIDKTIYNEGDWPKAQADADARVAEAAGSFFLAQEELQQSKNNLDLTKKLFDKDFETQDQLERDQLAVERAKLTLENRRRDLDSTQNQLEILRKYTYLKETTQFETRLAEMEAGLAQQRVRGSRELNKFRSNLSRAEKELENERELLTTLLSQVENTQILAPRSGMVVYYKKKGRGRDGAASQELEVGAQVNARQRIIDLPDFSSWVVDTLIPEAMIQQVRAGQKAFITFDAIPDQVLEGTVSAIGVLPDDSDWFRQVLQYAVTVEVNEPQPNFRPGMSAKTEIVLKEIENVLTVPIQAIQTRAGQTVLWVQGELGTELREVEVGANNDRFAEITRGLSEGEIILLDQPVSGSRALGPRPADLASPEQRARARSAADEAESAVPVIDNRARRGGRGRGGRGGGGGRGRGGRRGGRGPDNSEGEPPPGRS